MKTDLDQLAFAFFKLFAQYEYSLKVMGFGQAGRKQAAEADWDRFANEVGLRLLDINQPEIVQAVQYLFEHPPKRQVWIDDAVQWERVPNEERSAQILFSHIRRARNNLYHGGKFGSRWIDPDRSRELLSSALLLLERLVPLDEKLLEAIRGAA